jgi:hypothetical protein
VYQQGRQTWQQLYQASQTNAKAHYRKANSLLAQKILARYVVTTPQQNAMVSNAVTLVVK